MKHTVRKTEEIVMRELLDHGSLSVDRAGELGLLPTLGPALDQLRRRGVQITDRMRKAKGKLYREYLLLDQRLAFPGETEAE